ncbi:MAG: dockerin type I domain-containing protein [candidate division Zixibacteria bacterium]|nr:dockerin type I domain-containing protein [candidate division Zixibacteria bacterium]
MHKLLLIIGIVLFVMAAGNISGAGTLAVSQTCGDADGDGAVNIRDVTFVISFIYREGPAPVPVKAADVNNSGLVNITDVTYLINFLYRGGQRPNCSEYLGQLPPDSIPVVFAPGIISKTGYIEFASCFDPALNEFYFTRRGGELPENRIFFTKKTDGVWSTPAIAPFAGDYMTFEPFISPDGLTLLFGSAQPCGYCQNLMRTNIWHFDKTESGWSDIQPPEEPFCLIPTMFPTVSLNGNMYFTYATQGAIYMSEYVGGAYEPPVRLSSAINKGYSTAHSYIAPDESYMIFDSEGRSDGFGAEDLYISFKNPDGSWTESVNLGNQINTSGIEFCPNVSPDGKYLFFSRVISSTEFEIYWCDTEFIDKWRLDYRR